MNSNVFGGAAIFLRLNRLRCGRRCISPSVVGCSAKDDDDMMVRISRLSFSSSSSSSDNGPDSSSAPPLRHHQGGLMRTLTDDWNHTLSRHPQAVLASFLSAQSTTWLGLYASVSAVGIAMPPSLAAGWAIAKLTKKFRQPVHAALAAIMVGAFPALGEVKVTPLVTGFVMGEKDKKVLTKQIQQQAPPSALPIMDKVARGAKWLEGPVDKYGLSYYLSSRITGVSTICISAYLIHQGVDVSSYLSEWGAGGEAAGEAMGTAAAAAVLNICFVPLHFYSSVYGVRALEGGLRAAAVGLVDGKIEAEKDFRRDHDEAKYENETKQHDSYHQKEGGGSDNNNEESEQSRESEYERYTEGAMRSATMLLLAYSLMASLYAFRLMSKKATAPKSNNHDDEGK